VLRHYETDFGFKKRLWNAVSTYGGSWHTPMYDIKPYTIMHENNDAFSSRDCEPLIPGLAKYIYVNRFSKEVKTIYTIYNAAGHTFSGSVLALTLKQDEHLFDLYNCKPCKVKVVDGESRLQLDLAPKDIAVVARLPRIISVYRKDDIITVRANQRLIKKGDRIVVCDLNGYKLLNTPINGKRFQFKLSELSAKAINPDEYYVYPNIAHAAPSDIVPGGGWVKSGPPDGKPACVKLLRDGYLLDILTIPEGN